MSANIEASLRLEIAQYQEAMAKARGDITKLKEHAKREGAGIGQNLFKGIAAFAAGGAIVSMGRSALETVVKMDRMSRAMTTMEGSAKGAQARLAELREAAKLPGVGFEQAVQADIRLRNVKISAELSKRAIVEFGNALALSGGTAADLDGVILALGQIAAKGKVSAEEINQIAERSPQIRTVMKDVFGTADTEAIQKMNMGVMEFIERLIGGYGKLDRASAGLDEDLDSITQNLKTLVNEAAGPLVQQLVPAFAEFTESVTANKEAFAALGTTVTTVLDGVALYGDAIMALAKLRGGIGFAMAGDSGGSGGDVVDEGLLKRAREAGLGATAAEVEANRVGNRGTFAGEVLSSGYVEGHDQAEGPSALDPQAKKMLERHGQAKRYDKHGKEIVEKKKDAAPADAPAVEDQKAAAKALRDHEQSRKNLMEEQAQLARLQLDEYLGILPPNLKMMEVQREILRIKDDIENLPMHELDKLKLQQELVRWNNAERDAKRDVADEAKRVAEEAKHVADEEREAAEIKGEQAGALAGFDAEMALINAKLAGDKKLTEELERRAAIQEAMNGLIEEAGLSEAEALRRATARVDAESDLKNKLEAEKGGRYDADGRRADGRKKIDASIDGDANDARARAEVRGQLTRDRAAGKREQMGDYEGEDARLKNRFKDQFGGLNGQASGLDEQARKNALAGSGLANQAQRNAAQDATRAGGDSSSQIGPQILQLVQQIAESVK